MGRARRGFGRTAVVALVAAGSTVAALAGTPSGAQEAPPTDPVAPAAPTTSGTANASATVVSVAPTAGSLAFALTSGTAIAETAGGLAQSQAQSYNLGLIGSSLTAEQCNGDDGALTPEQLPQPTQVDNREGDTSAESTEQPIAGSTLGSGHERASATTQPAAAADVTSADLDLAPLVSVAGGNAAAAAEVLPDGAGRQADAVVTMDVDLGGVITLTGLRWNATHRTGTDPDAVGSFGIDALSVLGVPVPVSDAAAAEEAVNTALAETGLRIEMPRVERLEEPIDLVRVTPLRILIADSPLGAAGVRPALELTRDARSQLFDALVSLDCSAAALLLVGEIGIGVASGTGALIASLGGVEARTAEVIYEDPFGEIGIPPVVPDVPLAPGAPTPGPGAIPTPGAPAGSPGAVPAAPSAGRPIAAAPVGALTCESVHDFRWPDCSRGAAGVVGVLGGAATAAVALLDLRRRRPTAVAVAE